MVNTAKTRRRKARKREFIPAHPDQELFTVGQFCDLERAFRPGGVRWDIFRNSARLEEIGAIKRWGRRVLIHRKKYLARGDGDAKS